MSEEKIAGAVEVRVTYRDTDRMGHAYYSQYLVWFEIGRTELIRTRGKTYRELEERGIFLPVRECHCRYHAPARYDDLFVIHTTVAELRPASVKFAYRVERQSDGELIATGSTHHPYVNAERKILRVGREVFG